MFNLKVKFMLAAAVLFIGGVSAANAQLVNGSAIKVSVPSAFVLRGETLPAGVYTIARTPSTVDSPSLLVLRGEGEVMVFDTMVAELKEAAASTQLVFDTVDGVKYLSEIVVKGQITKNEIAKTKIQKRAIADSSAGRYILTITDSSF